MTISRSSVGVGSIVLTLMVLASPAAAQVIHPEGALPTLPADGRPLTLNLPVPAPLVVVASTDQPDGTRTHAAVWTSGQGQRSWLYAVTHLTFFTTRGGPITLRVVDGAATATGPGVSALMWPERVKNWSFSDAGLLPGSSARLLHLSVTRGSGCPSTVSDAWLRLDGGTLTTLLQTSGTGEGGGDSLWFTGTPVVWPAPIAGRSADALSAQLEAAFPVVGAPRAAGHRLRRRDRGRRTQAREPRRPSPHARRSAAGPPGAGRPGRTDADQHPCLHTDGPLSLKGR